MHIVLWVSFSIILFISHMIASSANKTRHIKIFPKNLKGTELNRCKKYGNKLDEIAEQV